MKNFFRNAWEDPVWSKVIAAVIIALGGMLVTAIKSICFNVSFGTAILDVLQFKLSLWIILVALFAVALGVAIYKKHSKRSKPSFVSEFTSGVYQNQQWHWTWEWSNEDKFYYVMDLNMMCPKCKNGVLYLSFDGYQCGKCGTEYDYNVLRVDSEGVRKQIVMDARKAYPQYKNLIGELFV